MNSNRPDLDLNLPTDIPDLPVSRLSDEAFLEQQRLVMIERAKRLSPEQELEEWKRLHAGDTPFVM